MRPRIDPPHRRLWSGLATNDPKARIGLLGVPTDEAASFRRGASQAPSRIRSLTPHVAPNTETGMSLAGIRIRDLGDVAVQGPWRTIEASIRTGAREALGHPFSVFLGGDHSITPPAVQETARVIEGRLGYLHIDAHLDLMDTYEGLDYSHACTARRVLELPQVAAESVVFVGIRSWLDEELSFLESHPAIRVETAADIAEHGVQAVVSRAFPRFHAVDAVYVSVDIDALDPAFAPGTGTPEAGGLSTRDLLQLLSALFHVLPVRAMDIVEVSPPLDVSDITSLAAVKVLYEAFGWVARRDAAFT